MGTPNSCMPIMSNPQPVYQAPSQQYGNYYLQAQPDQNGMHYQQPQGIFYNQPSRHELVYEQQSKQGPVFEQQNKQKVLNEPLKGIVHELPSKQKLSSEHSSKVGQVTEQSSNKGLIFQQPSQQKVNPMPIQPKSNPISLKSSDVEVETLSN